jgi:hypothetical protein
LHDLAKKIDTQNKHTEEREVTYSISNQTLSIGRIQKKLAKD